MQNNLSNLPGTFDETGTSKLGLAEGARFELADELPHLRFSRPARSATPSPLQTKLAGADRLSSTAVG